jgi:hypothetical protein
MVRRFFIVGTILVATPRLTYAQDLFSSPTLEKLEVINSALDEVEGKRSASDSASPQEAQAKPAAVKSTSPKSKDFTPTYKVIGIVRAAVGINSDGDVIFRRANADLNERNFRMLSGDQLNNRFNTFDPAIYSRIKVVMDAAVAFWRHGKSATSFLGQHGLHHQPHFLYPTSR